MYESSGAVFFFPELLVFAAVGLYETLLCSALALPAVSVSFPFWSFAFSSIHSSYNRYLNVPMC